MATKEHNQSLSRLGLAWLELLLVLAVIALVFQLFPSLWFRFISALDVRNWSRLTWFAVNFMVLAALIGVRYWQQKQANN
jgi:hypothetical protein